MSALQISRKAAALRLCLFCLLLAVFFPANAGPLPGPAAAIRIDFTADSMAVTRIRGYSNRDTGRALLPDDPVRIASISKLFVALAVMRLAEKDALDLDADVNRYLSWSLRNPAFPETPITLAHLLSHRSGLRDGINYALPMDALLPEELEAVEAWDDQHEPGAYFAYANLNSPVIAAILEAATGKRFDAIMREEVFEPLELDACFNWIDCSDAKVDAAVTLYRANGDVARDDLRGISPRCPVVPASDGNCDLSRYRLGYTGSVFSPQGGLRISAFDLARVGQMFLRDGDGYLQTRTIEKMADAVWTFEGSNGDTENGYFCAYGLGLHILDASKPHPDCEPSPFADAQDYWGHSGEAYALKSGLWFTDGGRSGTAFFRTQVPDNDPAGHCIWPCD